MAPATPLLHPIRFFRESGVWSRRPDVVLGLVFGSAIVLAAAIYGLGLVFAGELSGTVTVDNPAYPGDIFCEDSTFEDAFDDESSVDRSPPSGCDEPKTVERDAGEIAMEPFRDAAWKFLLGFPFLWLLSAGIMHGVAWLAGGDGTFGDTLAIGAWSGAVSTAVSVPGVFLLASAVRSADLDAADPEASLTALEASIGAQEPVLTGLSLLGVTWTALIWFGGLVGLHEADDARAAVVAGLLWLLMALSTL